MKAVSNTIPLKNMRLVVVSHKICRRSSVSASGFATDGGFPLQMEAISELFAETKILVPCEIKEVETAGLTSLEGQNLSVRPLSIPAGEGLKRKLNMPGWITGNAKIIWREVRAADAVHAPIPGDVGTIGILFAFLLRKPLFVRHCGNWFVQKTWAEHFWKRSMERFAGGRNVMLATGGATESPSAKNPHLKWIFSTSLRQSDLANSQPRRFPADGEIKLIIACRQEKKKGIDVVIASLPQILQEFPRTSLDVVGDGSLLDDLKKQAANLGLENRIVFHGKVKQSQVTDLLKRAHLFCYPTSASEGFPKVVLEALAAGLPVITTKVSVLPQLIGSGCGVLLDQISAPALANAVRKICSDEAEYNRMSARANRQEVPSLWSHGQIFNHLSPCNDSPRALARRLPFFLTADRWGRCFERTTTMRSFVRTSSGAVFRTLGSAAGDLAELVAICIFIGAVGIWARILVAA